MAASASQRPYLGEDGNLRFFCDSCGRKLRVPPHAVGKRVKCRSCESVVRVPPLPSEGAEDGFGSGDELGALEALASGEAVDVPQPVVAPPVSAQPVVPAAVSVARTEKRKFAGAGLPELHPLIRGTIGCAVGTSLGAALWVIIAITTEYELGFIAWVLGALAGFGMYIGSRGPSMPGAVLAGAIAGLGIVVAKTIIVRMILPEVSDVGWGTLAFAVVRFSDPLDFLFYALAIGTAFYRAVHGGEE